MHIFLKPFLFLVMLILAACSNIEQKLNLENKENLKETPSVVKNIPLEEVKLTDISNYNYSQDEKHVYRNGRTITELDPKTFKILIDPVAGDCSGFFVRDKDSLFFDGQIIDDGIGPLTEIKDIDIKPFQITDNKLGYC